MGQLAPDRSRTGIIRHDGPAVPRQRPTQGDSHVFGPAKELRRGNARRTLRQRLWQQFGRRHLAGPGGRYRQDVDKRTATAVFAGGCFWGVEAVFKHVKGVTSAVSGYAGGSAKTAHYEIIGTGLTGHAESVQVTYDPSQISYGQLLRVFFSVAHDPTQLNRQGPDVGTQYRSAIFYADPEQQRVAQAYIDQLSNAKTFGRPIVTQLDAAQCVLSGGGLSPGLSGQAPGEHVHRRQRPAEAQQPATGVSADLRQPLTGAGDLFVRSGRR